jgi:Ni,Fe-hydrogenase I cytochrome b subunit
MWAYELLKGTNFMPKMLGGQGELRNSLENVPYFTPVNGLLQYSLITTGYYIGDLFDTVLLNAESSDFWEMCLHHILTITLFVGMIFQNQMRIGVMISFIHNVSDVMSNITRGFS